MSKYVDFDRLMPSVIQMLFNEGVEESTFNKNRAEYAIRASYIEFVKRTNSIRRTYLIPSQANVNEYEFFKRDGYVIKKIYSVIVDCNCYLPGDFCACNCCHHTFNYQDGFLSICPAPPCDGEFIQVCASVFPDSHECQMEERTFELYGEEIASGAAHRLLSKAASGPYQIEYDAGIHRASSEAAKSWARNKVNSQKRQWVRR